MDNGTRTAAVTGATGFVGRHTVRALLGRGWRVRGLVRSGDKAARVLGDDADREGFELVVGDVFEPTVRETLVDGADAVIHTIGIRRELGPEVTFERLHRRATRRVLDAALAAGVTRWVQISALGVGPDADNEYARSKYDAEQMVRHAPGLEWTILRPSIIHGPDGEFMQMVRDWALGRSAPYAVIPYFLRTEVETGFPPKPPRFEAPSVQPVSVNDVAAAVCEALDRGGSAGEVYALVGPEVLTWPEMLRHVRDALPTQDNKPVVGLPGHAAIGIAAAAGVLGLGGALPFGPSEPRLAMKDNTGSSVKARKQLGIEPKPFRAEVSRYAAEI